VEGFDEGVVGLHVFARHENDLARGSGTESVHGRDLFAFRRFRAGGLAGIGAIDFGALFFGEVLHLYTRVCYKVHEIFGDPAIPSKLFRGKEIGIFV
jgi:hypothetical protein